MEGLKMINESEVEIPPNENNLELSVSKLTTAEENTILYNFLCNVDGTIKELNKNFNDLKIMLKKSRPVPTKKKAKMYSRKETVVPDEIVNQLNSAGIKNVAHGITVNKLNEILSYELFLNSTDGNSFFLKDGEFLHNNVFRFSSLDKLGFDKLGSRIYKLSENHGYKNKFISDIIHNTGIEDYDFDKELTNLTSDYSNAVIKDMFHFRIASLGQYDTKHLLVPLSLVTFMREFCKISIEYMGISDESEDENVAVGNEEMERCCEKMFEQFKTCNKKLFFSYITLEHLEQLYDIALYFDPELNTLPPLVEIYHKTGISDLVVVATYDINNILTLASKCIKHFIENPPKTKTDIGDDCVMLYRDTENDEIVISKTLVKQIKSSLGKNLEIFVNHHKKVNEKKQETTQKKAESDEESETE